MTLDELVKEIEESLNDRTLEPHRVADILVLLGTKYARAVDNYMVAKAEFGKAFTLERPNHKSDTATERYLEYQTVGLTRSTWKYQVRKCEMLVTTLKGFIYQKGIESNNKQ